MDFSEITNRLYIGTTPRSEAYAALIDLGVRLVINMRLEKRPYPLSEASELRLLWLPTFDSPLAPIPLGALERGARAALDVFTNGGKVYVHCAAGRHRGVAMGAAVLIAQGYSPQEAMDLIKARRPTADPDAWYIKRQILRFAKRWQKRYGSHPAAEH